MLRYFFVFFTVVAVGVLALAGFRGQKTRSRPLEIFNDMDHQPKFQPQHPSPFFGDGRAAQKPVPGTVPMGYGYPGGPLQTRASNSPVAAESGFGQGRTDYYHTGRIEGSYGDGLPVTVVAGLMARGKERFTIHCAPCHGDTGEGNGVVTRYGLNGAADLHQERIRTMPDGQIFNTITHGRNTMGSYGGNVAVEDRWAIIAYLRALQRSQGATLSDVPADLRAGLEGGAK
jgi:mono/diheme cytochrome c family protein